jgi:hypothetical protein
VLLSLIEPIGLLRFAQQALAREGAALAREAAALERAEAATSREEAMCAQLSAARAAAPTEDDIACLHSAQRAAEMLGDAGLPDVPTLMIDTIINDVVSPTHFFFEYDPAAPYQ